MRGYTRALFVCMVLGCAFPSTGRAVQAHAFERLVGVGSGEGAGALQLAAPQFGPFGGRTEAAGSGLALAEAAGVLVVADTGNSRVDEFEVGGGFLRAFGGGVEPKGADVCTEATGCRKGAVGSAPGDLPASRLVAVDNSGGASGGDVYAGLGVGRPAVDELQFVEFTGALEGTYTLSFEGHETGAIAWSGESGNGGPGDKEAARLALEQLPGLAGNVNVAAHEVGTGRKEDNPEGLEVEFTHALADTAVPVLGLDGAGLLPAGSSAHVVVEREGAALVGEVVSKFGSEGKLVEGWGDSTPTPNGQLVGSAAPRGPFGGQLQGLAVDPEGDLWVLDSAELFEFSEAGTFVRSCPMFIGPSASGLQVNAAGDVFVVAGANEVQEWVACGGPLGTVSAGHSPDPSGFAFSGVSGNAFVDLGGSVEDAYAGCLELGDCETFGEGHLQRGDGLVLAESGGEAGKVFVADSGPDQIAVFRVSMEAVTLPASEVRPASVVLNGEVNPRGTEVTRCVFQYGKKSGETTEYGNSTGCATAHGEPIGAGQAAVSVHADLSGLTPGITYDYRIRVLNAAGEEVLSEEATVTTLQAASIEDATTSEVTASSALVSAKVNPHGLSDTRCQIEYGTSVEYGLSAGCEPEALSGGVGVSVSRRLEGLSPQTAYHWRVRVTDLDVHGEPVSILGADNTFIDLPTAPVVQGGCPNEALRAESDVDPKTGLALSRELPDCRAYEMVTTPHKNAALVGPIFSAPPPQISEDGGRVLAVADQCFAGAEGCTGDHENVGVAFEFTRGGEGWSTHPTAPPASVLADSGLWGYDADTGMVLYSSPVAGSLADTFFAAGPSGAFEAIGPMAKEIIFERLNHSSLLATGDLSHVVYGPKPTPGAWPTSVSEPLWEYAGAGNSQPFLVDTGVGQGSNQPVKGCSAELAGDRREWVQSYSLSVSGRVALFNACTPEELYARVDGEMADARTVFISGRSPLACTGACASSPTAAAAFEGASEDGSIVYFTSTQRLMNEASEDASPGDSAGGRGCVEARRSGCNLYLFAGAQEETLSGRNLIDVSAGDTSGLGPRVQGVMAVSKDGSHVYYLARGVLAGANASGASPLEGLDNLYMYERDAAHPSGRTVFIATLPDAPALSGHENPEAEQWGEHSKAASVSEDGQVLVFTSRGALTADDTRVLGPEQVYRYDAQREQIVRVSVGAGGFNDDGNAGAASAELAHAGTVVGQTRRAPTMSADGSVVFFQSPVALTPRALNDVPVAGLSGVLAENVYEWEAAGSRGCGEAGGCVYLISDGEDVSEDGSAGAKTSSSVELLGSDARGENVFFATADRLVPVDTDSELDIYDARVGGGFPAPTIEHPCEGEGCRPAVTPPASEGPLATLLFTGPGDLTPQIVPPRHPYIHETPAQIRAKHLKASLKACRKDKRHEQRVRCEKAAHRRYGPAKKAKKASGERGARR